MRLSSCILFCLLSASLVSGITIQNAEQTDYVYDNSPSNEMKSDDVLNTVDDSMVYLSDTQDYDAETDMYVYEDTDEDEDQDDSSRSLLRWKRFVPKPIQRIFAKPAPKPAPAAAPKAAPKPAPKPAPVVAPKPAPVVAPKPAPVVTPKPAPVVTPKPAPVVAPKPAPVIRTIIPAVKVIPTIKKTVSRIRNLLPRKNGIKIYGNYCGPNYCGGQRFKGAEGPKCQWGVAPKDSLDSCCKVHDQCCGSPNTRSVSCNQNILNCIRNVKCEGNACKAAQTVMRLTFDKLQNNVCGNLNRVNPAAAVRAIPLPVPVPTPAPASVLPIYVTCDNEFDLYVNGNKIGRGTHWMTTYHFSPLVKQGDVIAIDGVDQGGPAAFIGVFGGKVTKPSEWRCSTKESPGWNRNIFDDSSWANAVSYGRNQDNNIWRSVGGGSRPNIPADAEWLWTSNNENHNRVYCRYFPMIKAAPAPVASPVPVPVAAPRAVPVPVPVAAPRAAPVASPVPVAAPRAAPVASPVPVVAASKPAVIDEIISTNQKTNAKLTKFQEKLIKIMKETSDEQVNIENENRNNYNGVSVTLQNEQRRLESVRESMKKLYSETQRLNTTIQAHYKKLIADTKYLESLDALRPAFLKSLGELATHIAAVKSTVDTKIYKDEYKDEMIRLLTSIHFNTHNVSGYVATAFVNHYNKYKALIQKENGDYSSELKRLTVLSNEYKIEAQKSADIEKERARLQGIFNKLKETLTLSVAQREEFDRLVKDVVAIFNKKKC